MLSIILALSVENEFTIDWLELTLNGAGPNPTYSVRRGGQIWPLLKIEVLDTQKWSKSGFLIFLPKLWQILSNFCFHGNVEKITFWTTFVRPKIFLIPIFALYRVTVRGGSDLTTFENRLFRHPKAGCFQLLSDPLFTFRFSARGGLGQQDFGPRGG